MCMLTTWGMKFLQLLFSANNFALSDAEDNTSGPLNRGGIENLRSVPTFSSVFIECYIDQSYIDQSFIFTFLSHCYSICFDYTLFYLEVEKLRETLKGTAIHLVLLYRTIHKNFFKQTLCSKTSTFNSSKNRATNNSTLFWEPCHQI